MVIKATLCALTLLSCSGISSAAEPPEHIPAPAVATAPGSAAPQSDSLFMKASRGAEDLMNSGLQYMGIRYRFGGTSAETGFDCSGLVHRVFMDALGLNLPRTAREMSNMGERIDPAELKPGDLVFFKTMRHTFSHVGIYLGDNRFLHSPSAGGKVRVEDMTEGYWRSRFNGARRLVGDEQAQQATPQIR